MTAIGRKQPLESHDFIRVKRPLLVKADIQIGSNEYLSVSGWYAPESSRSTDMMLRGCYDPKRTLVNLAKGHEKIPGQLKVVRPIAQAKSKRPLVHVNAKDVRCVTWF